MSQGSSQRSSLTALGATVIWAVSAGGGFSAHAQVIFVVLALALLSVNLASHGARAVAAFRDPVTIVLLLVGVVSVLSAGWTLGSAGTAVRDGMLAAAYAVVAVATRLAADDGAGETIAVGIAGVACAEALVGLIATATHTSPEAERLAGVWRPGGTFEYQPALALLQVGALPIYFSYLGRPGRWPSGLSAAAAALAGATVALSGDRLAAVLAVVTVLGLLVRVKDRPQQLTAWLILVIAGGAGATVALVVLRGAVGPGAPAPDLRALGPLVAVACFAAALGARVPVGSLLATRARQLGAGGLGVVIIAAVVVVGFIALAAKSGSGIDGGAHVAGFFHGRLEEWRAAIQTWRQRPLLGSGAGTYYLASLPHQTVAISRFAHDLPLECAVELGVPGLLLSLALYAAVGWTLMRSRLGREMLPLAVLVAAFMVSNLLDWTWHLAGMTALWAMAVGALPRAAPVSGRGRAP